MTSPSRSTCQIAGVAAARYARCLRGRRDYELPEALKPNEAIFLPSECIVARSESGTLRYASGWFNPTWRRGDVLTMAREHAEGLLTCRPDAGYYRREIAFAVKQPSPVANVGRRNFYVVRQEEKTP